MDHLTSNLSDHTELYDMSKADGDVEAQLRLLFTLAPRYGAAQQLIGPALASRRDRWFVGCKTSEPSRDGARADLERSLELLQTDHFELYQLHAVTSVDELDRKSVV